ncbi:MAG: acyl-CoA dehydrogenase family protein, partial [bacterium]|nr:acyl-CoA dehydrogenase family protein [bacterium]
DEEEKFAWEAVEKMKEAGLFAVYIPEEYGGLGGKNLELVIVIEELSRICGAISLALAATALGAIPIMYFGSEEQKKKYLPPLASGDKLAAFTITEPEAGSDATATRAVAVKDGDYYILNGTKIFCTNGEVADIYTTFFSTNPQKGARGISAFIIEKGTPGFKFGKKETKMGIRASPTYELIFENCRIPKENLLGKEGMGLIIAQKTFDVSRPGVAAQALGIAQGAFEEAFNYAKIRKQFGQPIIGFQVIQHKFAEMAMRIEAARALLYEVCKEMDADPDRRWTLESAYVKTFCSDVAMYVTNEAIQICGGIGYMRDFPVEKYFRDAKITQIYEGTNEIQRNEIALHLIKRFGKELFL